MQAPYPADTRAKGWRFELGMEAVKSSETWLRAKTGAVRGALLLLWAESWEQKPCGTLPDDDELIALLIDMPPAVFAKHKAVLLRGWVKADDGRLYHDVITERVLAMLDKRASDAQRAANRRARIAESTQDHAEVTRDADVTPAGVGSEFDTKHQAPSTSKPVNTEKAARKRAPPLPCPEDVNCAVWDEWLALRKLKRAPVSASVIAGAREEAGKAGVSLSDFLRLWVIRGSQGFYADWIKPNERGAYVVPLKTAEPQWRTEQRQRTQAFAGRYAAKPTTYEPETIDAAPPLLD